jgi:hypothetical protein
MQVAPNLALDYPAVVTAVVRDPIGMPLAGRRVEIRQFASPI